MTLLIWTRKTRRYQRCSCSVPEKRWVKHNCAIDLIHSFAQRISYSVLRHAIASALLPTLQEATTLHGVWVLTPFYPSGTPHPRNLTRYTHSTTARLRRVAKDSAYGYGDCGLVAGMAVPWAYTCLCCDHHMVVDDFTSRSRRSEEHMGISDSTK